MIAGAGGARRRRSAAARACGERSGGYASRADWRSHSLTAIFGDPVAHSLSPAMHNAAYAALAMDRVYVAFHVAPAILATALRALPALGILGVNLTVPHKERALRMVAKLTDEARMLRAVNCVVNRAAGLYGDNTDARGLEARPATA